MKRFILILCLSLLYSNPLKADPCPEKTSSLKTLTGIFLKETLHEDCFGYLIQESKGKKIDVMIGNDDPQEFQGIKKGDLIRLSYKTEQFPDRKQCLRVSYYETGSGKILKKSKN